VDRAKAEADSIFCDALELASPAERAAYLDRACGGAPELRRRVERLLEAHAEAGGFLAAPPAAAAATCDWPAEAAGTVVGPYKLLEPIGEGGFGVVFLAEQQQPLRRKVALKVVKPGMDSKQVVARFEAERQALAIMDHPNIARVLDGGATTSGRPYFVMELVKGAPITAFCDQGQLSVRQRLGLFVSVCRAVQHAHQKGVIHRDLKPSNVLVTVHDTTPAVKVIDFGVAKALGQELTDKTLFTGCAQMVGTPPYMSPEQAGLSGLDVDTRSDVYSLGVLLYELLTGTTPFARERLRGADYDEIRRIIREEEPARPSTRLSTLGPAARTASANRRSEPHKLSALLRGELDWVVLKALEKDRNRRYESASAFAADVERYLHDEPVLACPPSAAYRFRKFARRNKGTLLTLTLAGGVLAATAVLLVTLRDNAQLQEAINEAATARDREAAARRAEADAHKQLELQSYHHGVALASVEWRDNHLARADQLLNGCPSYLRHWEWYYLQRVSHPERLTLAEHRAPLTGVAYSPDGKYLASADDEGWVILRDAASGRTVHSFKAHAGAVRGMTFSPDSRRLAFAAGARAKIWDIGRRDSASLEGHKRPVVGLAFSRDGKRLASASADQVIKVWDAPGAKGPPSWKVSASWEVPLLKNEGPGPDPVPLVFSPDGQRLASAHPPDSMVRLWEAATGRRLRMTGWGGPTLSLAMSPDGRLLAGGGADGFVRLCDLAPCLGFGVTIQLLRGRHGGPVTAVAFSPDGRRLASGSADQTVKIWDPTPNPKGLVAEGEGRWTRTGPDGEELWTLKGHTAGIVGLAYSPDGKRLASADRSGKVRVWDADLNPEALALKGHEQLLAMAFTAGGEQFLTAGSDQTVKVWHAPSGRALRTVPVPEQVDGFGAFSPDGRLFAGAVPDAPGSSPVQVSDATTRPSPRTATEGPHPPRTAPEWPRPGNFAVKVWDTTTGAELQVLRGHTYLACTVAFSPDNRRLATGSRDRTVRVWEVDTGRQLYLLAGHTSAVYSLAFSPDGTRLASGERDKTIKLWDLTTGRELHALHGHTGRVLGLSFGPSGRRLASASADGTVKVWDLASGRPLLNLPGHLNTGATGVAFSPDGQRLVTVGFDQTIKVWDAASGENPLSLRSPMSAGRGLLTIKEWDAASGEKRLSLRSPMSAGRGLFQTLGVVFSPDGWRFATATPDTVQIWDATPRGN
jgi:WD40 repeat protein/serine/threonine protein kinase